MSAPEVEKSGFAGRIAAYFINSRLTLLIVIFSMLLGLMAISSVNLELMKYVAIRPANPAFSTSGTLIVPTRPLSP